MSGKTFTSLFRSAASAILLASASGPVTVALVRIELVEAMALPGFGGVEVNARANPHLGLRVQRRVVHRGFDPLATVASVLGKSGKSKRTVAFGSSLTLSAP